ncbi:MAG TPA: glycosyltransferase [Solirubrobacteraceae bacterium]|nr:glycosyltransferase [Solirubrobacteraceae bacterium]
MRALVLSAPVGESHAAMARALAADLRRLDASASVTVLDDLSVLGPRLGRLLERGFRRHLGEARRSYDVAYRLFTGVAPARRFGEAALYRLGGQALAATVARHEPDVVVSTYPVLNPVLAGLRRSGRVGCPAAAVVDPLGGLGFWVAPGLDLHMLHHAEALEEVRRRAGGGRVVAVRPLVREEFYARDGSAAPVESAIPAGRRLVVVSGGGWGAGDLDGAIRACLRVADTHVIAIAGRNERLREELAARHRAEPRVTVRGFVERMAPLLRAADALVTATAGLSCLEARLCGCPVVCYGFLVGHVRDNTAALARHGLARVAATPAELVDALQAVLAEGRPPVADLASLPRAAELVAALT